MHRIYEAPWELRKEEDGIRVFTRNVPGSAVQEFKAVATFSCPVQELLKVARDPAGYSRWIADCKRSELLKTETNNSYIAYLQLDMPWPASNRDLVLKVSISENKAAGYFQADLSGMPDFIPAREDFIRIPAARGFFRFTPTSGGKVEVVYQFHADPGGSLPSRLVNSQIVKAPWQTLKNLRKLANG